jgi:hypothetical protein
MTGFGRHRVEELALFLGFSLFLPGCTHSQEVVVPVTTGRIDISSLPEQIRPTWTLTGPEGYLLNAGGDTTMTGLGAGDYTLYWHDVAGWNLPVPPYETKSLQPGQTTTFIGVYGNPTAPIVDSLAGGAANGSQLTITGSGFGSHKLDVEWLGGPRLEALSPGSTPDTWGPGWRIGVSSQETPPEVSTERPHSGALGIKAATGSGINEGFIYEPGSEFNEIYATWWVYFNPISDDGTCTEYGPQWKVWRLNATTPWDASFNNYLGEIMVSGNYDLRTHTRDNLYLMNWCGPVPDADCTASPSTCWPYGYPGGMYGEHWLPQPWPNDAGKWVRWEVYVKASSAVEVKDGSIIFRMLLPDDIYAINWLHDVCTHRDIAWQGITSTWLAWTRFCWQNYWGNCGGQAEWFFDDIYLQFGNQSRVELGDVPVWETCTHREIQKPTAWSDGSVTVELNYGSFTSGQTVYLFVVRNDGAVSTPVPLVLQ